MKRRRGRQLALPLPEVDGPPINRRVQNRPRAAAPNSPRNITRERDETLPDSDSYAPSCDYPADEADEQGGSNNGIT